MFSYSPELLGELSCDPRTSSLQWGTVLFFEYLRKGSRHHQKTPLTAVPVTESGAGEKELQIFTFLHREEFMHTFYSPKGDLGVSVTILLVKLRIQKRVCFQDCEIK